MYEIIILPTALKDLKGLDKAVAQRVSDKLTWFSENIHILKLQSLKSNLSGFFKLRVGDWRVLYEVDHAQKIITVHKVGHRSDIYK